MFSCQIYCPIRDFITDLINKVKAVQDIKMLLSTFGEIQLGFRGDFKAPLAKHLNVPLVEVGSDI